MIEKKRQPAMIKYKENGAKFGRKGGHSGAAGDF
jgi:hypothetical protein